MNRSQRRYLILQTVQTIGALLATLTCIFIWLFAIGKAISQ